MTQKYVGAHRLEVARPMRSGGAFVALTATLALALAVVVWSTPTALGAQVACTGAAGLLVMVTAGTHRRGLQ